MTRRIITFLRCGEHYRRDEEVHHQRLYEATDIVQALDQIGFQVEILNGYGEFNLPPNHAAIIARKLI
ncbi:MAG: hypothetical protein WBA39_25730 [Rivularia sp. (in: cyanobacteria)]